MFTVDDEVKIIANKYTQENNKIVGQIGIIEEIDEKGIWVSIYNSGDWYLCDEDEIQLVSYP